MFKRLSISGFRGIQPLVLSAHDKTGLLVLCGPSGSGKSAVYDSLAVVQQIARGATVVSQLSSIVGQCSTALLQRPLELALEFDVQHIAFRYELCLAPRLDAVLKECLRYVKEGDAGGVRTSFVYQGGQITHELLGQGQSQNYVLPINTLALSTVVAAHKDDPLSLARQYLAGMLMVRPDIPRMNDSVLGPQWLNDSCANLSNCIAMAFQTMPAVYSKIEAFCMQMIPGFEYLIVRDHPSVGRFLYLRKNGIELSVSRLSSSEKIFLIAAFVAMFGQLVSGYFSVWDDFLAYIPDVQRSQLVDLLRRSCTVGQCLVCTSVFPSLFSPDELIEVKPTKGVFV